MTIDEIKKKDWQVLTAYASIKELAYLKTILENQAVILAHLTNQPTAEILKNTEKNLENNYQIIDKNIQNEIPNYSDLS